MRHQQDAHLHFVCFARMTGGVCVPALRVLEAGLIASASALELPCAITDGKKSAPTLFTPLAPKDSVRCARADATSRQMPGKCRLWLHRINFPKISLSRAQDGEAVGLARAVERR